MFFYQFFLFFFLVNKTNMTHTDDNIKQIILTNRPNLALGSVNTYMASYRKLKKESGIKMDTVQDMIDNYKQLLDWMMENMDARC
jgi:hypothetical protein